MPLFTSYIQELNKALDAGDSTEHTHRPALKELLQAFSDSVTATNEPKRSDAGMPDFDIKIERRHGSLSIGKVEAKDVGTGLKKIVTDAQLERPRSREGQQLKRYLSAFPNLILTNHLDFHWFTKGEEKLVASVGVLKEGLVEVTSNGVDSVSNLMRGFLNHEPQKIRSAKHLAQGMANTAAIIHDVLISSIEDATLTESTTGLREAFRDVLVADLTDAQFADMLAQTLAYGLFAGRVHYKDEEPFTRRAAAAAIPKTTPFLRGLFAYLTGPDLEDEPHGPLVDDLAQLLADTNIQAILRNFGADRRDPIVHFYETFLASYDSSLREVRGVYYTPLPLVSFIVNSVDSALRSFFGLKEGVADTARNDSGEHKVLILDPATGTGTFLYEVIGKIRQSFIEKNRQGLWAPYVREHLLPRLFGFELMMAPYAVAHLKLSMQLSGRDLPPAERKLIAYEFDDEERLAVFLTNALDPAEAQSTLPLGKFISDEANAASTIKSEKPIMVVLGNPPYQGQSPNASSRRVYSRTVKGKAQYRTIKTAIGELLEDYYQVDGKPLGEQNPKWLQDDYVKFIRLGQSRIEDTSQGILAYVTNHTYLDAPTFRGMRQNLLQSFDHIYILDLHGSTRRREINPDGTADENVFDQIQQGVSIVIFIKTTTSLDAATVHYADLWGTREKKYKWLETHDLSSIQWTDFTPTGPFYNFRPENVALREEWDEAPSLTEIFPLFSTGIVTHRDHFAIDTRADRLQERLEDFCDPKKTHEQVRIKYFGTKSRTTSSGITYKAGDNRDWQLADRRTALMADKDRKNAIEKITHRPFDNRHIIYHRDAIDSMKYDVMRHMTSDQNLGLISARSNKSSIQDQFFITDLMSEVKAGEATTGSVLFPLWLYGSDSDTLFDLEAGRKANLGSTVPDLLSPLGLVLSQDARGDLESTAGPEDVLAYVYSISYSRAYRVRYESFLRSDYPRIPFTSDIETFRTLVVLGHRLISLHLLSSDEVDNGPAMAPSKGDYSVEKIPVSQRWVPSLSDEMEGSIILNSSSGPDGEAQIINGVPQEVWNYSIGGHQVIHKWLDARIGDQLTFDETIHLIRSINAIKQTIDIQDSLDEILTEWPIK
jgi:predicted helicase